MKRTLLQGFPAKALALSVSAISASLLMPDLAFAQDEVEEITVTGSRIRQTDGMAEPVPVTVITPTELQDFEPVATVAEQLDALPQFFGTQSAQRGGGALFGTAGGSYLNMRSLGQQRTLVLLDGSRVVPADKRGSVNVDTLPTALMKTVDVVTGGASAAYGADALGGVTNFVLDRQFQGLKIQTGTGITEFGDGQRWNLSIAGGKQFGDKLNVIGSLQAMNIKEIERDPAELDSDWWQRWGWVTNPAWKPGAALGTPQRITLPWVCSSEHSPSGVIWARNGSNSRSPVIPFSLNGMTFTDDGADVRKFITGDVYAAPAASGSTKSMSGSPECVNANNAFGGGPSGAEVIGRSAFLAGQYQFSDNFSGFAQVLVGRSESNQYAQRGGYSLQDGWFATIYRDNAFLPANVAQAMDDAGIGSFQLHKLGSYIDSTDIGAGRRDRNVFGTYSWSVGFDMDFDNAWHLRGSWQSGESDKRSGVYDAIRVDRMFLGMDAVRDPATGAIVCRVQLFNPTEAQLAASSGVQGKLASPGGSTGGTGNAQTTAPLASPVGLDNSIGGCVPYNVMGAGNLSKAAQDYVSTPKIGVSNVTQDFAELLLTGEAYEGWGYGPISFAAGLTWRDQSFTDEALPTAVDVLGPPLNAPELGIQGIPPSFTGGSANLHQFSTVPNVDGQYDVWEWFAEVNVPIWESTSGQQRLGSTLSYRSSDYSSIGRIESWKVGADFQVFEDLRLRATKSRDVREATFAERFDAQGGGGSINDPRFNGTSFQITSVSGGNPNLTPEQADTIVAGLVYQPSWFEGFQLSTDWYRVEIRDAVGTLGLQRIVDECEINKVTALCGQFDRDPTTGFIGRIWNVFLNVAQAKVEGLDFEAVYQFEPNFFGNEVENLSFRALAGYLKERSDTPLGGSPFDVSGTGSTPDLTANITATYSVGPYSMQLQGRYIADVLMNGRWVEGKDVDDNTIPSSTWWNARLGYNGETSSGSTWNLSLNIQNLFDRNPPIWPSYGTRGGAQSTPNQYDVFGRRYALNLNYNF
jgi:iron complex outermembrane receptor protein